MTAPTTRPDAAAPSVSEGRALLAAATEGPYRFDGNGDDVDEAALAAYLRNHAAALLDALEENERLRAQITDANAAIMRLQRELDGR
jgi:hypothetical protein